MYNWKKWIWPGVFTTVILTALSVLFRTDAVQNDLSAKALDGLSGEHSWAEVTVSGRDLTLRGTAPSEEAVTSALQIAESAYDVRVATSMTELLPIADPFVLSAVKADGKLTVSGNVPSDQVRQQLLDVANSASGGAEIIDEMALARGAPEGFDALAGASLAMMSGLDSGKINLSGTGLEISGLAAGLDQYDAVISGLSADLPAGGSISAQDILPPAVSPYEWKAEMDGKEIVLSGFAPNEDAKTAIGAAVESQVPGVKVTNNLRAASGAPAEFKTATDYAAGYFPFLNNGAVTYSDSEMSLSGTAKSSEDYEKVVDRSNNLPAGYTLAENTIKPIRITPPPASPYRWSISKTDNGNVVRGYAPSTSDAAAAVEQARAALGASVTDKQVIASGQPEEFAEVRELLTGFVGRLEAGQGNIVDTAISVTGRASSEAIANFINVELKAKTPEGYHSTSNILWPVAVEEPEPEPEPQPEPEPEPEPVTQTEVPVADPYRWSLSKLPDTTTVLGNIADEADGKNAVGLVQQKLGAKDVVDKQIVAAGKPDGFDAARELVISQVRFLEAGQGNIIGNKISITGRAKNENIRNLIDRTLAKRLPAGFTGSTNIVFPKSEVEKAKEVVFVEEEPQEPEPEATAEACQAGIVSAINGRKIQFETARAVILTESEPVLDAVLDAASKCPELRIRIGGHTDDRGRDNYNQKLSEARAASVVKYLSDNGLDSARLEAKGFGETSPIASNDTAEGRGQNRRIEFNVLEGE